MEEKKEYFKNKAVRIILAVTIVVAILLIGVSIGAEIGRFHSGSQNYYSCGRNRGGNFSNKGLKSGRRLNRTMGGQRNFTHSSGTDFIPAGTPPVDAVPNNAPNTEAYPINNNASTTNIQ